MSTTKINRVTPLTKAEQKAYDVFIQNLGNMQQTPHPAYPPVKLNRIDMAINSGTEAWWALKPFFKVWESFFKKIDPTSKFGVVRPGSFGPEYSGVKVVITIYPGLKKLNVVFLHLEADYSARFLLPDEVIHPKSFSQFESFKGQWHEAGFFVKQIIENNKD